VQLLPLEVSMMVLKRVYEGEESRMAVEPACVCVVYLGQ